MILMSDFILHNTSEAMSHIVEDVLEQMREFPPISEDAFIDLLENGIYDKDLVGKRVILTEESTREFIWHIIRVNDDSYDLWKGSTLGEISGYCELDGWGRRWKSFGPKDNVKTICEQQEDKLSCSVRNHLVSGLNPACGIDKVCILSATQLGCDPPDVDKNAEEGEAIPIFSEKYAMLNRSVGVPYWTTSYPVDNIEDVAKKMEKSDMIYCIGSQGALIKNTHTYVNNHIVPAIRLH